MQAPLPAAPTDVLWDLLVKVCEGAFALLIAWTGHGVRSMKADVKAVRDEQAENRLEMARWRVAIFGINGDNGINGNVKTLMREREDSLRGRRHNRREDDA